MSIELASHQAQDLARIQAQLRRINNQLTVKPVRGGKNILARFDLLFADEQVLEALTTQEIMTRLVLVPANASAEVLDAVLMAYEKGHDQGFEQGHAEGYLDGQEEYASRF